MKLSELLNSYSSLLRRLIDESKGIEYTAMFMEPNPEGFEREKAAGYLNSIRSAYITGIVERAHLASITSIARNLRWLEASNEAMKKKNVLAFSASIRGYLESCADGHDLMKILPSSLESLFCYIYLVLNGAKEIDKLMVVPEELEARLIHFAYAKRKQKGVEPLPNHLVKSNRDYISEFERFGVPRAGLLYGELCELTHPAAASVSCFLDECDTSIVFNPDKDDDIIYDLLSRYEDTITNLTLFSINPALISLCFLHRLCSKWPSPSDDEISTIGSTLYKLHALDDFVISHNDGVVDWPAFFEKYSIK